MFKKFIQKGPLQAIIVVYVILYEIGVTFLAGFFLLFAILPIKAILAKIYNKFRYQNRKYEFDYVAVCINIKFAEKSVAVDRISGFQF